MSSPNREISIGLLWHSVTSDNLGVGALTFGQMALIKQAAAKTGRSVRFLIVGTRGGTAYPLEGYDVEGVGEFALRAFKAGNFQAISLLRRADCVFDIGEGDSFSDIYGNKRLAIQVGAKVLSKLMGKPLILSPQTIGPFKTGLGKRLGNLGMGAARRIYARDHLSMDFLQKTNHAQRAGEVIDVAFALPFQRPSHPDDGTTRVGINVSGLLYNGGYGGKNEFALTLDYRDLIERTCQHFLALPGVSVYLVPHVISDAIEVEDDLRASQQLAKIYPQLQVAPRFKSPIEAKSFISGLDFFTGARMHACIAAFSSGVPVVPMAYSRKFNGLFNSLGYRQILDCLAMTGDQGLACIQKAFDNRDQLAQQIQEGNAVAQTKLSQYVDELAALLPA